MKLSVAVLAAAALAAALHTGAANAAPAYCSGSTQNTTAGIGGVNSSDCTELYTGAVVAGGVTTAFLDHFTNSLGGGWTFVGIDFASSDRSPEFFSFDQYIWTNSWGNTNPATGGQRRNDTTRNQGALVLEDNPSDGVTPEARDYDILLVLTGLAPNANGVDTLTSGGLLINAIEIEGPGRYGMAYTAGFVNTDSIQYLSIFARVDAVTPPNGVPEPGSVALLAAVSLGLGLLAIGRRRGRLGAIAR